MHYGTFVSRHAARYPDRIALLGDGYSVSYAELDERSNRLGHALRGLGLAAGDRIALMTDNRWECVEVMVSAAKAGLVFVPLDFRLDDAAAAHLLRHSGARAAVIGGSHREQAARLAAGTAVEHWIHLDEVPDPGRLDYAALLAGRDPAPVLPLVPDDAGFCILYTSGTTGMPKGVYFTHQQTMDNAMAVLVEYGLTAGSRYLVSYPHNSAGSVNHVIGPVLMAGGTLIIGDVRNFDAQRYYATVERYRITHSQLVPTMVFRLLAAATTRDLSSLTTVGYASAPIPAPRVAEMLDRFGPIFIQAFGMTETCSVATVLGKADHAEAVAGTGREGILASCGRASYGVEVAVVDDDDQPVPPGAFGEVVMRGRWLLRTYWRDEELTAATNRGGWLHSGDVGYLDAQGYLYLVDRKKDLLIIGGANIASKEIEDVLYEIPGVLEAAVIGAPDEEWGERPHAVLSPAPGHELDPEAVHAHCRDRLPTIKRPVQVTITETMPKTSTGKISKPQLRSMLAGSRPA
jgi:acyl-CoA synthetase (AMP-forming)/AMP-acid ligase II